MTEKVKGIGERVKGWFGKGNRRTPEEEKEDRQYAKLLEEIAAAKAEWAVAQQNLDVVSEPDLIDYAIYNLEAAERKYGYLLREAKKHQAAAKKTQPQGHMEPLH